jgi:Peptidase S80 family
MVQILECFEDGSFKAIIRKFEKEGVDSPLFQKRDYEPHMSRIQTRADHGVLCGEMGNPVFPKLSTFEQNLQRTMMIFEELVCCRFNDVKIERILDCGQGVSELIEPAMFEALTAVVMPVGRFKAVFEDVLANPDLYEFAARAIAKVADGGSRFASFVTWDLVPASRISRIGNYYVQRTFESLEHS